MNKQNHWYFFFFDSLVFKYISHVFVLAKKMLPYSLLLRFKENHRIIKDKIFFFLIYRWRCNRIIYIGIMDLAFSIFSINNQILYILSPPTSIMMFLKINFYWFGVFCHKVKEPLSFESISVVEFLVNINQVVMVNHYVTTL